MITVGIPAWNAQEIIWLSLESLCRQNTSVEWELLIFEEEHDGACGEAFFQIYLDGLIEANCVKFTYFSASEKVSLSQKWRELALRSDKRSKMFCIVGADNYYEEFMIQDAYDAWTEDHDFVTSKKAYWYNFHDGTLVVYHKPKAPTGAQMAIRTDLMRNLPNEKVDRLVDRWIYQSTKPRIPKVMLNRENTLGTHGFHNISGDRRAKMMKECIPPFYKTDKKLEDIVPSDVAEMIKSVE